MLAFLLIAAVFAVRLDELSVDEAWQLWQKKYASTDLYGVELKDDSYTQFQHNYDVVKTHNSMNSTYWLELNQFAAISFDEFNERNGFLGHVKREPMRDQMYNMSGLENPKSVDWRGKLVTPVKYQGDCGACWAFSTVAALEGQYAKLTETLLDLSEQDLVDCVKNQKVPGYYGTCCSGCDGGNVLYALQYIMEHQDGVHATESAYPYTESGSSGCSFSSSKAFHDAEVTAFVQLSSERDMEDAVANIGPISVSVYANDYWQNYKGGVYNPSSNSCSPDNINHAVTVVGYGVDNGLDYWLIKNSWGKYWGEDGYIRLAKGSNTCGVATYPGSYPAMH